MISCRICCSQYSSFSFWFSSDGLILALTIAVLKWLAVNAIAGLLVIGLLNFLGVTHVPINLMTLLVLAVGGILGAFILIILSVLHLL
ncbi:pro-sigmaK processing inhibitor BofA family protein [Thermococcus sp.]|uniref:pro-sigmaK processing inhibitor BofA family protein n=1 Tax=Thermococcus sp. TaxID=35749 RepID=UPI00260FEAE9|nr:pro-sigmaK processing inhibitor BofA family protein [Thermococcus sp.]